MNRPVKLAAVLSLLALTSAAVTVTPKATDEALVNPDMGFVMFHYSNRQWGYGQMLERGDTLDWFPGTSCAYFRLPWCLIEPKEGQYRWDIIDSYARPWIAAGKQIGFRITCCEARYPFATPEWVKASGAKGWFFKMTPMHKIFGRDPAEGGPELWEPDYGDPVFLAKLENFLKAMGRRYDGKPYVAFVDVGSVGMFGEGHTRAYKPELLKVGRDPEVAFHQHYEIYRRCFPNTNVLCVDDQAGGGWNPHPDPDLMRHARNLGFGFRDDSILVSCPPHSWKHANWAQLFAPGAPVFVEHEHYSLSADRGAWSGELLQKSIEEYRASWLSIHGWPREELDANARADFAKIARRIGYRFELRNATWPDAVTVGEAFEIASEWVNVGVARRYKPTTLCWTLVDDRGRVAWSVADDRFDFSSALPKLDGQEHPAKLKTPVTIGSLEPIPQFNDGVLVYMQHHKAGGKDWRGNVPTIGPGDYTVCVSLGDAAGVPQIALPLEGGKDRLYPLGKITVKEAR